jgi:hypothetical protein
MNILVLRPWQGQFCQITIASEGAEFEPPFDEWALRTGDQILYANNRMANDLKMFYMHGSYQTGAAYLLSVEEMRAILTSKFGPNDFERYVAAKSATRVHRTETRWQRLHRWHFWGAIIVGVTGTVLLALLLSLKFLMIMMVLPFVISWVKGSGHH